MGVCFFAANHHTHPHFPNEPLLMADRRQPGTLDFNCSGSTAVLLLRELEWFGLPTVHAKEVAQQCCTVLDPKEMFDACVRFLALTPCCGNFHSQGGFRPGEATIIVASSSSGQRLSYTQYRVASLLALASWAIANGSEKVLVA